jgi:hypothetical protein
MRERIPAAKPLLPRPGHHRQPPRTSCTRRSFSGIVSITASKGRRASRLASTVLAARLGQTFGQPVSDRLLNGVAVAGPHPRVQFRMQLLEPVPNPGLGLAPDLLADPLRLSERRAEVAGLSRPGRRARPGIVGHPGDGQPKTRMSARYARIRPALSPSFPRSWVNRGE